MWTSVWITVRDVDFCVDNCQSETTVLLGSFVFMREDYTPSLVKNIFSNVSTNLINVNLRLRQSTRIPSEVWIITIGDKKTEIVYAIYRQLSIEFYTDFSTGLCPIKKTKQISTGNVKLNESQPHKGYLTT